MKTFNVLKHPTLGFQAVKIGFSWPAFFFGVIWMLAKKMWIYAITFIILYIFVYYMEMNSSRYQFAIFMSYLFLWLLPAFKGNNWRKIILESKGYELIASVNASNPDSAVAIATSPDK